MIPKYKILLLFIFLLNQSEVLSQFNIKEIDVRVFANHSIIGLGEESHGIKTINEVRNKISFELVKRYKVRYIIWEDSFANLYAVNKLLEDSIPNYDAMLTKFTWFWQTEETRALLKFIFQYNHENPKAKIKLLGMDLSSHLASYLNIIEFFEGHILDPEILKRYEQFLPQFKQYKRLSKKENRKLKEIVNVLLKDLGSNEVTYNEVYSLEEIALIKVQLQSVINTVSYDLSKTIDRDKIMFQIVDLLYRLCNKKEKIILYAHNEHLQKKDDNNIKKVLGMYLDEKYGVNYYAMGFEFGAGDFICSKCSIGIIESYIRINVLKKNISHFYSSEKQQTKINTESEILNYLYSIQNDYVLIDLERLNPRTEIYKMLHKEQLYHSIGIGCMEVEDLYAERIWADRFDGMFYIKNVKASEAVFTK